MSSDIFIAVGYNHFPFFSNRKEKERELFICIYIIKTINYKKYKCFFKKNFL